MGRYEWRPAVTFGAVVKYEMTVHDPVMMGRDGTPPIGGCVESDGGSVAVSAWPGTRRGVRPPIADLLAGRLALTPAYQPILCLASGRIAGYEALARFPDGMGGTPHAWFREARALGLGAELEALAIRRALETAVPVPRRADPFVSVNVSPRFLADPAVRAAFGHGALDRLVIELTEDEAVDDYARLRTAMAPYLARGARFAIDDTGAGFASMRHVTELWPAFFKLDATLTRGLGDDPRRQALVRALAGLALDVGATLIVEGVEEADELTHLARTGLPLLVQGYAIARPGAPWPAISPDARRAWRAAADARTAGETARSGPDRSAARRRRAAVPARQPDPAIEQAINVGGLLAPALRRAGVDTLEGLRALGASGAWDRLRTSTPALATPRTLLALEGAVRGVRWWHLPAAERRRLVEFAATP